MGAENGDGRPGLLDAGWPESAGPGPGPSANRRSGAACAGRAGLGSLLGRVGKGGAADGLRDVHGSVSTPFRESCGSRRNVLPDRASVRNHCCVVEAPRRTCPTSTQFVWPERPAAGRPPGRAAGRPRTSTDPARRPPPRGSSPRSSTAPSAGAPSRAAPATASRTRTPSWPVSSSASGRRQPLVGDLGGGLDRGDVHGGDAAQDLGDALEGLGLVRSRCRRPPPWRPASRSDGVLQVLVRPFLGPVAGVVRARVPAHGAHARPASRRGSGNRRRW